MKARKKHDELLAEASQRGADTTDRQTNAAPQELIQRRAYELYQQRSEGAGDALSDWLRAEAEIAAALGAPAADNAEEQREVARHAARNR
jgi:hypothetical protein